MEHWAAGEVVPTNEMKVFSSTSRPRGPGRGVVFVRQFHLLDRPVGIEVGFMKFSIPPVRDVPRRRIA